MVFLCIKNDSLFELNGCLVNSQLNNGVSGDIVNAER